MALQLTCPHKNMKCCYLYQVGEGQSDHQCWERPEDMDTPRTPYQVNASFPGSDVAGEAAAALAASSMVFQSINTTYSETMLNHSKQVESKNTKPIKSQSFCWPREGCRCRTSESFVICTYTFSWIIGFLITLPAEVTSKNFRIAV